MKNVFVFLHLLLIPFFLLSCKGANGGFAPSLGDTLGGLQIVPASFTMAATSTKVFTVTGGTAPYTFSVSSGTGTMSATVAGRYRAASLSGLATVRVTDSAGKFSESFVTINPALNIVPLTATILIPATQSYAGADGIPPYTYSVVSGPGSVNASTGLYTPVIAGDVTVRVTDAQGNIKDSSLIVNGPLSVSPTTAFVVIDSDLTLDAVGGTPPYTFSIVVGGGVIDSVAGIYTAPLTTGSATLRTTDSAATAATVDTAVTIYNPLTLSPLLVTLGINSSQAFTASGGVGTLTFSVVGSGTINSSTGAYVAPAVAGTDIVRVTDTIGNVLEATVRIVSSLTITPSTLNLPLFSTMTFTSVLGTAPYTYSVPTGTGTINSTTGLYTAPGTVSAGSARVTDAVPNSSDAVINHIEPIEIVSGSYHSCVRYNQGTVKCFGDGAFGQLGHGSTSDLADVPTELGGNLPFVNLGTGRTAKALTAGISHTCALLDNDLVKCWGHNGSGQLGIGGTAHRGDGANEMGDLLPAINLGTDLIATKIYAFGYMTCAILNDGSAKCFGKNASGQLGQDDIVNRGTSAAQMGDSLLPINLGAGRTAVKMSGGLDFTCALLDNATLKCFGNNKFGQLGYGNTLAKGKVAGDMAALATVGLGAGRTVVDIGMGYSHSCAILDNGTQKCWGRNQKGQLGVADAASRGDDAGEMGDNLLALPFTAFTPTKTWGGSQMQCSMNATGAVRCWGFNSSGQLLIGNTLNRGDDANEIANLLDINLGTGISATTVGVGYFTACVITNTKRLKCWGNAANGALANGTTTPNLGDAAGEVGDGLPFVNH